MSRSRWMCLLTIMVQVWVLIPLEVFAQGWPSGPIRIVVPFTPGGSVDAIPRLLQPGLQERLGVPVIVETRPGASGAIGTAAVAKAVPNGSTWLSIADTLAVNGALYQDQAFDVEKDLEPVLRIGTSPYVLAVNVTRPYGDLADVIAAARARSGGVSYASFGSGSGGHLAMLQLGRSAGTSLVHVPYRGGGPAVADAIAGHVDMVIGSAALLAPLLRGGKLRGIAQFGPARLAALTDLPTVGEAGFKDAESVVWWGIFTTAGTPKPVIERIRAELVAGLSNERVARQLSETMQIRLTLDGPEALRGFLTDEIRRWGQVIRDHAVKPD